MSGAYGHDRRSPMMFGCKRVRSHTHIFVHGKNVYGLASCELCGWSIPDSQIRNALEAGASSRHNAAQPPKVTA